MIVSMWRLYNSTTDEYDRVTCPKCLAVLDKSVEQNQCVVLGVD